MAVFATFSRTPVKILRTSVDDFCRVCNVNIAISGWRHFHLFEGKTSLQNNVAGRLSQVLGFEVTRENGLSAHLCLMCKCVFAQNLGPNPSEMEVRTFVSKKKVIWEQLLAFKALIFEKKAFFNFYEISATP